MLLVKFYTVYTAVFGCVPYASSSANTYIPDKIIRPILLNKLCCNDAST